ncbi:MAG: PVC-type heme-binding CxxCH protein [Rubripirellula sp.]
MIDSLRLLVIGLCCTVPLLCMAQKRVVHDAAEPLAPTEAAATMRVPEGFRVSLFAGEPEVMQPIGFCLDDRARLWVAEAYNYPEHGTKAGDRIVILEDSDGDGKHDQRTVFYDGLNYVSGIEVGFGGVWVMSPPYFYFIPDSDGDDVPDAKPQVLLDGFGNHANAHNMANAFAWGPDGWLYGTHGRTNWSMIGKPGSTDEQRERFDGGVYRYHPTQHVWEPFADGATNMWGIDWNDLGDAFVCNCVNPHLFQVIQGAHYEPWRGRESSQFAYQRIDTIADHLHFVGLGNVRNGIGSKEEDQAGGGHAHCGTMIYLGDGFPPQYRNQLFTNNIHGRRINNDLLKRSGSGYTASHGPDLMRRMDPWFMGVTLAYGPGGEVYVSDWSDTGECHSTRNTRKSTGRIYRMTYLKNRVARVDVGKKTSLELAALQSHDNDWFVRHARRILQERSQTSEDLSDVNKQLREILRNGPTTAKRLRGLWALQVTGALSADDQISLLADPDESVRGWAIRLLCEAGDPNEAAMTKLLAMARGDHSAKVRLELASALQRFSLQNRWAIAEALAAHGEDARDQNLPLMTWYGIEPLIADDLARYAAFAYQAAIPQVRENIARRIASSPTESEGIELLCAAMTNDSAQMHADILRGLLLGIEGRTFKEPPKSWSAAFRMLERAKDPEVHSLAIELAMAFQDPAAIESLQQTATNAKIDAGQRRTAMRALSDRKIKGFDRHLITLLADPAVREQALRGLARYKNEQTAAEILANFSLLNDSEKRVGMQTLATRVAWAHELLTAVEENQIPQQEINALVARQLGSLDDADLQSRLKDVWGGIRETPKARAKQIAELKKTLTPENLSRGNEASGKALFTKHCSACHRFFGEGGKIGPDLTGAQRTNLDYLLENVVDPSASVANAFRMELIRTVDGRVITGLVESQNERLVTIVNATDRHVISKQDIEQQKQSEESVMPTGLLDSLGEREIRDLFMYLQR